MQSIVQICLKINYVLMKQRASAFEMKGIDTEWDVDLYGKCLQVGGGKERMTAHWNEVGWPESIKDKSDEERQSYQATSVF